MSFGPIISQGHFTADGAIKNLEIRSDIDWIRVINLDAPVVYEWYRGMGQGTAIKHIADGSIEIMTANGFSLIDSSASAIGANDTTITAIVNLAGYLRVISTYTSPLNDGDIVRIGAVTTAHQLGGVDFTIGACANTRFDLIYMANIAAPGVAGNFHKINFDPLYYPRTRTIASITQAAQAVVQLTVTHNLTVGQKVRFSLSSVNGMPEIDGQIGTIVAVSTIPATPVNTITVDIDSSGYTPFVFGTTAQADGSYTHGEIIPIGETAGGDLLDATINKGFLGMSLAPGNGTTGATQGGPAGVNTNVIYWIAGKSDVVN
jgi:hypothetical protein